MSEYGRNWEHQRSTIEDIRKQLKQRPALVTLADMDAEIERLTRLRAQFADAEKRIYNCELPD